LAQTVKTLIINFWFIKCKWSGILRGESANYAMQSTQFWVLLFWSDN